LDGLETDVRSEPETPRTEVYQDLRPLLFSIAYGIVGSVSEAEDIVQEAFLRFHREQAGDADIDSPKAWLSTVTTRLAINQVRSARARRETYVGTWLPEPLLTDPAPDAAQHAETADALSMALLVLLETLTPVERAVFLLREVFDYGYDEIAAVVGKSEANCRQIAARARRHIASRKPRFEASRRRSEELARRFFQAVGQGDTEGLIGLLAADVVAYADGGATTPTFMRPVYGRERIARLLPGLETWLRRLGAEEMRLAEVNGQPGAVFLGHDGRAVLVVALDIADGLVQTIRAVSNPDKLRHLGPRARRPGPLAR
jgi:RNA polymerase sigma-70 factor, ECF subfamily